MNMIWFDRKIMSNHTINAIILQTFTNLMSNQSNVCCNVDTIWFHGKILSNHTTVAVPLQIKLQDFTLLSNQIANG